MEQERTGFSADRRAGNDNRKQSASEPASRAEPAKPQRETLGQRWGAVQPTKMTVFWFCLASIILTMIIGFNWGGWVRASTAQKSAALMAQNAVVQRLTTFCVGQFNLDANKEQKLQELIATSTYKRAEFVTTQGWATLPGEEKPDNKVADACAKQLALTQP
jgi:hypothetical protein